jgi:hypothetical protein
MGFDASTVAFGEWIIRRAEFHAHWRSLQLERFHEGMFQETLV